MTQNNSQKNSTKSRPRQVIVLNMLKRGGSKRYEIEFAGVKFEVEDHCIGWDYDHARQLVERHDGEVDAIVVAGVREFGSFGDTEVLHHSTRQLMSAATKTPVYVGTELQTFCANWTIRRALKNDPMLLRHKKVLFHMAVFTPYSSTITAETSRVSAADPLMIQVPMRLDGSRAIENFLRITGPLISTNIYYKVNFLRAVLWPQGNSRMQRWIENSDIFVTYASLMKSFEDYECFKGKILIIDTAPEALKRKLVAAGVAKIIEFLPDMSHFTSYDIPSFAVFNGLVDQVRIARQSRLTLSEFTLNLVESANVMPKPHVETAPPLRRCAFVVHPLSVKQLLKSSHLSFLETAPHPVTRGVEKLLAHVPMFPYGQVLGSKSELTGQEVICDIYALTATPRALMEMKEENLYKQLLNAARAAKDNGALMLGLGAYTKVAGDAGVTVARRSPIPITTGNSYSAAATLWAARVMVERMQGMTPDFSNPDKRPLQAKAMVVGATGSIGRVSSLLLAQSFSEIVLVATRPEKLLELRDEINELHPNTTVKVSTLANPELSDTDLVVTATSSRGKSILDIMQVKPGAVICDCSRPLDISPEEAAQRPDVMVIESGEIDLPGMVNITHSIGLPKPSVYACLAETVLLTMEGRFDNFSLSRTLNLENVKEIYSIGKRHGAKLSAIRCHQGVVTDEMIANCKRLAEQRLESWEVRQKLEEPEGQHDDEPIPVEPATVTRMIR